MKKLLVLLVLAGLFSAAKAQLRVKKKCDDFAVDILRGKVNGLKPDARQVDIINAFPCSTGQVPDGNDSKCGGEVLYKDKDIFFYTQREYIEIGDKFKGKLSMPLMGAKRSSLFNMLGNPALKDDTWDAFQMAYGTLVLHYNSAGRVNKIQFSTKNTEQLSLCQ